MKFNSNTISSKNTLLYVIAFIVTVVVVIGTLVFINKIEKNKIELSPVDTEIKKEEIKFEKKIIGNSVEGRDIEAYIFGDKNKKGDRKKEKLLLFVGGIHGGYEWNSVVLAYQFIDYIENNSEIVPQNLTIAVIPSLNPDGVFKVIGKEGIISASDVFVSEAETVVGRFNANNVDLNRNFDCKWKSESTWRGNIVSAGTSVFSEPEAVAIRDFVLNEKPDAVVFWHSQANAVYASECEAGILPETINIMNTYSKASGYKPVLSFDAYEVTGDAEGWLASINIPAITVELKTHETIELEQNISGVKALFDYYKD